MGNVGPVVDSLQVSASPVPAGGTVTLSCTAHEADAGHVRRFRFTVSGGTLPGGTTTAFVDVTAASPATGTVAWSTPAPGDYTASCSALDDDGLFGNAWSAIPLSITVTTVASRPAPVIDGTTGAVGQILPGSRVALSVAAHDPEGGALTYAWAATGGTLAASGSSAIWTAPATPGAQSVTVTVAKATGETATAVIPVPVALAIYEGSLEATFGALQRAAVAPTGEIYVVDGGRGQVAAVTRDGRLLGAYALPSRPVAIAFAEGRLEVSTVDSLVLTVEPDSGRVVRARPLDGIGAALAYDPGAKVLWVAERSLDRVRAIRDDGSTAAILTDAGGTRLLAPTALAVDAAHATLWVALATNETGLLAHAFTLAGVYQRSAVAWGSGDGAVTRTGGIAVDAAGQLYVSDMFQGQVQVVSPGGAPVATLGSFGSAPGQLVQPADLAALPNGDVLVLNQGAGRLDRFGQANPLPTCAGDSDCDGMPDAWELAHGLNPYWAGDALLDLDGDGLTNLQEYRLGTDPRNRDTDGDGVPDGQEVLAGANPLDPSDHLPALVVPGPKTSDPGVVRFATSVRGPAGCTVAWRQRSGPPVAVKDAATFAPWFVARVVATYQLEGVATCGAAKSPAAVLEARIQNVAPVADPGRLAVADVGGRALLDGGGSSDANGDTLAFAWDQTLGAPVTGAARGAQLALTLRDPGLFQFRLTATDAHGASGAGEVAVLVPSLTAETPTAIVVSPVVGLAGAPVVLDAAGSAGADAGAFAWTQVAGPAATLSDPSAARPSFTPAVPGRYAFQVTAGGRGLVSPPATVEVLVAAREALPLARAAAPAAQVAPLAPVTLDGSASADADGAGLSYEWRQLEGPAAGLTDGDRAVATAVAFEPGHYAFRLVVREGAAESLPVVVRFTAVQPGRALPVAVATGPGLAYAGTPVTIDGSASRKRAPLGYRWVQVAGPWVSLDDSTAARPSFVPLEPGLYTFELVVTDGRTRSAPASVSVLVFNDGGSGR